MYNEAKKRATMKYQRENMDQIAIRIPKGKREIYKQHAENVGKPLYKLICDLIEEDMRRTGDAPEPARDDDPEEIPPAL